MVISVNLLQCVRAIEIDLMQYDTVYLTCSKKLACSELSLPHATKQKHLNEIQTKNKPNLLVLFNVLTVHQLNVVCRNRANITAHQTIRQRTAYSTL